MRNFLTSISTLNATDYKAFVKMVEESGASMVHCDYMDGEFVDNKSLDIECIKEIKSNTGLPLDVHLMVNNPKKIIDEIMDYANIITIHYESFEKEKEIIKLLEYMKKHDIVAGLSFDLNTNISNKLHILKHCNLVLLMSVKAGKGGQEFNQKTITKIAVVEDYCKRNNIQIIIEVDGGINLRNITHIKNAGADVVVLGTAFFEAKDKAEFITKIKKL